MRTFACLLALSFVACTPEAADGDRLIDGILLRDVTSATWVDGVDNAWFPLPVGATWDYSAETPDGLETIHVEVLAETREVNGVTATVVYDVVALDDVVVEETWDWYAQDTAGNVWYLGEDTCEFEAGECAVHAGAWEWGVDGALPGVLMPGEPVVDGQPYFQEYHEGVAEDVGEILEIGGTIEVGETTWTDCVRTADTSHLDPELSEEKVYCAGVGNVHVSEPDADVWLQGTTGL